MKVSHSPELPELQKLASRALACAAAALLMACGGADTENASNPTATASTASSHSLTSTDIGDRPDDLHADGTKSALAITARPVPTPTPAPAPAPRPELAPDPAPGTNPGPLNDPASNRQLTVRAFGSLAGNVGPVMEVRVDGRFIARAEVRSTTPANHVFTVPAIRPGSKVDVVFANDAVINGEDRNLFISHLQSGGTTQLPYGPATVYDRGAGAEALDGRDLLPGTSTLPWSGALRVTWPATTTVNATAQQVAAARLLKQATFGPTTATINRVVQVGAAGWIAEQMALPFRADFVNHVNSKFALGVDHRPGGSRYDANWVTQRFWATAATSNDQLRKRVAWALHQMLMVSQTDSNLISHTRAYAEYLDTLNRHAFGNYRQLLEEVALSPAMGVYLSHIRNQKEDSAQNRQPDENFARELMQLFAIGLVELNIDGTVRSGLGGKPIETYNNQDVMAMAKVFTGYGWGFPNNQLNESNFKWGEPAYQAPVDSRVDLSPMKVYADWHSTAPKVLFPGQRHGVNIPAQTPAATSRRMALDSLFAHPNMGPFIGRQLIQHLVTSSPSPAYVARVAAAFNNNGAGTRGDMAAVVRAVLLDVEARNDNPTDPGFGRLREPVLRTTHWMRAMDARSASGEYTMVYALDSTGQRALFAPSVFGYYRPGYVPPQSAFSARGATAPEFQIVNESTTASWVNLAQAMTSSGLGWNGSSIDVSSTYGSLAALTAQGNATALVKSVNLLLFGGTMSASLAQILTDAIGDVHGTDSASHMNRARLAVFLSLASPEYLVQR